MPNQHTPGPWRADELGDVVAPASRKNIAIVAGQRGSQEADANARLIAAAPEMLAALRDCIEQLEWAACAMGKTPADYYSPDGAWANARALLARIEGT